MVATGSFEVYDHSFYLSSRLVRLPGFLVHFFFFNDTATTEIYTLSLHDALPISGAERMPHDLSHLGFLAGQIGRLITISTTPVIAGDSFEMDAVGALRLSPLRRGLAIDSTVDIFTFYVPHRHVYG